MWNRDTKDPLARLFLDRFGMHILARPRENVAVYDVFPVADSRAASPGSLEEFVGAQLALPKVTAGEEVADVSGTVSESVSWKLGFDFLAGFLAAIAVQALVNKLSAMLGRVQVKAFRFRFSGATRESADPFAFERSLRKHHCSPDDLLMKEGYRYYVAVAVHRTDKLSFTALDARSAEIDMSAEVAELGAANIQASAGRGHEITIQGDAIMAYGVELSQLIYNDRRSRLELAMTKGYVQTMAAPVVELPGNARSMIGGAHDSMILTIEGDSSS